MIFCLSIKCVSLIYYDWESWAKKDRSPSSPTGTVSFIPFFQFIRANNTKFHVILHHVLSYIRVSEHSATYF